jgi:hypothetical protein
MPGPVDFAALKRAADKRTRTYTQAACVARGGHCYDGRTTCKHCGHAARIQPAAADALPPAHDYPDW